MGANSLTWNRLPEGPLWLISPHLRVWQKQLLKQLRKRVPADPETIWIFSSGTRAINQIKCIGLKRAAILTAAAGANTHLQATRLDRWLIPIPTYHIGGFAILARAFLSGSAVEPMGRWLASDFITTITQRKITLTSLVPAQVYDLVRSRRRAPSSVRAIVVGGGALDPDLYVSARDLGWPLLPSYGLTESAAQVATAKLSSLHTRKFPDLAVLPHAQIELRASRIFIRSPSLCHWIATLDRNGVFTL
ncbi:MAG: AMP-binding protein, partial [Bdellovibrionales bacterium]